MKKILSLFFIGILLFSTPTFAAVDAGVVWEYRTGGNNDNGGGFAWVSLVNSTYKWTVSGSGTAEYYCELSGGGDPSLTKASATTDGAFVLDSEGVMGSLAVGEWDYGDNDTLGYSTFYVRLDDEVDPDTKREGFVSIGKGGGTDYSQQVAAQLTLTDGATSGAGITTFTSATGGFTAAMVGNILYLKSGTNATVAWYEITVHTDTNTVTLDRAPDSGGAVSSGNFSIGGSRANFIDAQFDTANSMTAGNKVYVASGTYATAALLNISKSGTGIAPLVMEGYQTTRGDAPTLGNRPLIDTQTGYWQFAGSHWYIKHLRFQTTGLAALSMGASNTAFNVKAENTSGTGSRDAFTLPATAHIFGCEAISTNGYAIDCALGATVLATYVHDSATGVRGGHVFNSVVETCTTGLDTTSGVNILGNTIYNNTTGISLATDTGLLIVNNLIDSNTTGIASGSVAIKNSYIDYNNYNGNTTDYTSVLFVGDNNTTVDPTFTDAPNGNFTTNNNVQATGTPGSFPGGLFTSYPAQGAYQADVTVAGASNVVGVIGG